MKNLTQGLLFDELSPSSQMTDEQRSLAIKWRHYALQLAKRWHHCYGGNLADWQSEAMMGLCLAALKYEPTRQSAYNGGAAAFVSCVWHQVRSKLNVFRLTRDHGGMRYVPRGQSVKQDDMPCVKSEAYEHGCELQEAIESAKSRLNETERVILNRRFDEGETLEVVGKRIGVTRERVRQIQEAALGKMREVLTRSGVDYAGCC